MQGLERMKALAIKIVEQDGKFQMFMRNDGMSAIEIIGNLELLKQKVIKDVQTNIEMRKDG